MTDLLNRLRNDAFVNLDITDYTPDMQGWKYNAFDTIFSYFVKNLENPAIIEVDMVYSGFRIHGGGG